ncbi:hypothetical protein H0537_004395 [Salmonella enterica]|nr:hypothetical protein [Salmonella enterica]EBN1285100.1 hypothetical protein [Salmonella enterica]EBR6998651.1 hypothetical protein [Salmonella enterica]EFR2125207.1 hypothetical protein [Salmonella enterica]EJU7782007.1 hypothetical protein [Salmonella enterica subsp. arizonae serovar 56:z36:-]
MQTDPYEQSFENGDGRQAEIKRAGERYRATAEARVRQAREVCQRGTELKRAENQRRHSRPEPGAERCPEAPQQRHDRGHAVTPGERDAPGNAPVAVSAHDLAAAGGGVLWLLSWKIAANLDEIAEQNATLEKLNAKTWGVTYLEDSNGRFLVLPKGMKAEAGWTVANGKRNAVKLVKE